MASLIFLGNLKPFQKKIPDLNRSWGIWLDNPTGYEAIIAKGNIIEGIEAKE